MNKDDALYELGFDLAREGYKPEVSESELSDLLCSGTDSTAEDKPSTIDTLNEAMALIKALAPPEAPEGAGVIKGVTGLNIMKNDMLPENTVIVSKRLFDLIYESSNNT